MEYIDVINEETKLKERLKACEEKYALDVLSMTTRLEELSKHKEDFQNGHSSFAFAREYIDVDNPLTILLNFPLYIDSLKKELTNSIDYHPNLGSINFSRKMPVQYFSDLIMELEKLPIIKPIATKRFQDESVFFDPFYAFPELDSILEFKIKTNEYDYTNLLKLLNFPEEFSFSESYYNDKGMYKLIGDSYVFHKLDKCSNQWYSVTEAFEKFKEKNWR